jgi:hypothetical protein
MIAESIKEKLGLLKLYLTILIATAVAGMVWIAQNVGNASILNIFSVCIIVIICFLLATIIEIKIHKLINFLENL